MKGFLDWLTENKTNKYYDEPEHIAKERQKLHNKCGAAYNKYGTIRHPKWEEALKNLRAFERKHGTEYNPD